MPPPLASGYVEMRVAGTMMEVAWTLRGGQLTIVSPVGQFHCAERDPFCGSVEDQARGMIPELWEALKDRARASDA